MRIAVLSDIHSNHNALEACLGYVYSHNFYGIVFLGDYITDCAYPKKMLEAVYGIPQKYNTWFIRGNREDYMISHHDNPDDGWHYCSASGSLLYTFENITGSDIDFFRSMPVSMNIKIEDLPEFTVCHGSVQSNRTVLRPGYSKDIEDTINEMKNSLLICGHGHIPFVYEKNGRKIMCAGSVGIPCNNQIHAQFTTLEFYGGEWKTEIITVPYNVTKAVSEIDESGLSDKAFIWAKSIKYILQTGRNINSECVRMVSDFSKEYGIPYSDEALWVKAAGILGLL